MLHILNLPMPQSQNVPKLEFVRVCNLIHTASPFVYKRTALAIQWNPWTRSLEPSSGGGHHEP
jgi:hypothetical protein